MPSARCRVSSKSLNLSRCSPAVDSAINEVTGTTEGGFTDFHSSCRAIARNRLGVDLCLDIFRLLQPGNLEDFLFVQGFLFQKRLRKRVEFTPVFVKKSPRLVVAFADDAEDFVIYGPRSVFTKRLSAISRPDRIV